MISLPTLFGRPLMAALLSTAILSGTAMAQSGPAGTAVVTSGGGANMDPAAAGSDLRDVGVFDLAQRMFALGRANQDPLLVIAAARLALSTAEPTERRTPDEQPTRQRPADVEEPGPDRASIVAAARQMAASSGDATLIALAQGLVEPSSRGRTSGPVYDRDWVSAGYKMTYRTGMVFRGQELAEVSIAGGPNAKLNLYVYDENGGLICVAHRAGSNQYCSWIPRWTGPFRIVIDNVGNYHSEYILRSN
jgi:hypothetical protein